jgi:transposase
VVQGRPRLLTKAQLEDLLAYLDERPDAYLDEMAYYIFDRHSIDVSIPTVSRLLKEGRWSRKKAKKVAAQRNADLRAH